MKLISAFILLYCSTILSTPGYAFSKSVANNTAIPSIQPFFIMSPQAALDPPSSEITPGQVISHALSKDSLWRLSLFVVGNDDFSKEWLQKNSSYLQHKHIFGIATGFTNMPEINAWSQQFHVVLFPAQLSGFSEIIKTNHYPLLIENGWVLQ